MKRLLIIAMAFVSTITMAQDFICKTKMTESIERLRLSRDKWEQNVPLMGFSIVGIPFAILIYDSKAARAYRLNALKEAMNIAHLSKDEWVEQKMELADLEIIKKANKNLRDLNDQRKKLGVANLDEAEFNNLFPEQSYEGIKYRTFQYYSDECDEICSFQSMLEKLTKTVLNYENLKDFLNEKRFDNELCQTKNAIKGNKKFFKEIADKVLNQY